MTDNPKIRRPPLEAMRRNVDLNFTPDVVAIVIDYALTLEAELATTREVLQKSIDNTWRAIDANVRTIERIAKNRETEDPPITP